MSTTTTIPEESVAHIAVSLAAEQSKKKKRHLNIIVHNVDESEVTDDASCQEKP